MYLAQQGNSFYIRKSYFDTISEQYRFRQIFDLGSDPARYIKRLSEHSVYFAEELEDALSPECKGDPTTLLEDLLWGFLPAEERQRIKNFRRGGRIKLTRLSEDERNEVESNIHMFDRRRLYYIRYGAVDQSRIFKLNDKLYRPLLYKCRDEKEYYFKNLELSLPSTEFKKYVYVIFNLQRQFTESFASFMPEALDGEKVDDIFEKELCRLNGDKTFWQSDDCPVFLHHHLQSYLTRYFDYEYAGRSFNHDYFKDFRARHRAFRWPERNPQLAEETISEIFDATIETLRKMSKGELTRLFRKKAKEFHPDSGGDTGNSDKFIQLLAAYQQLKR